MTGLLLIGAAIIWFVAVAFITRFVLQRLPERPWRWLILVALVAVLIPLPLIDELIGRIQFERLCDEHSVVLMNLDRARGRSVMLKYVPHPNSSKYTDIPRRLIAGTAIPIREDSWDFVDLESGAVLVSYKTYEANGGWFIRALGISEGNVPLTFDRSYCAPPGRPATVEAFRELGINYLERTAKKLGG